MIQPTTSLALRNTSEKPKDANNATTQVPKQAPVLSLQRGSLHDGPGYRPQYFSEAAHSIVCGAIIRISAISYPSID